MRYPVTSYIISCLTKYVKLELKKKANPTYQNLNDKMLKFGEMCKYF